MAKREMRKFPCAQCGEDVTAKSSVEIDGKRYCRKHTATKNIVLRLYPDKDTKHHLENALQDYRYACNAFLRMWLLADSPLPPQEVGRIRDTMRKNREINRFNSELEEAHKKGERKEEKKKKVLPVDGYETLNRYSPGIPEATSRITKEITEKCPRIASGMIQAAKQFAANRYKNDRFDIHFRGCRPSAREAVNIFEQNARTWELVRKGDKNILVLSLFPKSAEKSGAVPSMKVSIPYSWNHKNPEIEKALEYMIAAKQFPMIKIQNRRKKWIAHVQVHLLAQKAVNRIGDRFLDISVSQDPDIFLEMSPSDKPLWRAAIPFEDVKGWVKQYEKRRTAIQKGYRLSRDSARNGHGRKRALQTMEGLTEKRNNYQRSWNHRATTFVIREALRKGCSGIRIEDLCSAEPINMLGDWAYHDFLSMLEAKCKEKGLSFEKTESISLEPVMMESIILLKDEKEEKLKLAKLRKQAKISRNRERRAG